jgi:hypothetical protein
MVDKKKNKRYFWALLKEPKFVSAMLAASYTALSIIGLIMIGFTPGDLVNHGMRVLSYFTGSLFLIGGALGVMSLHGGEWWLERACIYASWAGLFGYICAAWIYDASLSEKIISSLFVAAFSAQLAARFYKIRGLTLDPTK